MIRCSWTSLFRPCGAPDFGRYERAPLYLTSTKGVHRRSRE